MNRKFIFTSLLIAALAFIFSIISAQAQNQPPKNYIKETQLYEYITVRVHPKKWHLIHVGHNYRVPYKYVPPALDTLKDSKFVMDSRVAPHYNKMYDAALADGVVLIPISCYRSVKQQESSFNSRVQSSMEREGMTIEEAVRRQSLSLAYPGASEHNLGLCLDIGAEGLRGTSVLFADTEQFAWLDAHAADYGFILRFPNNKTDITGYVYEPWHWRYVGVELARELKEKGITLDEYYGRRFLGREEAKELKEKGVSIKKYLRKQGKKRR